MTENPEVGESDDDHLPPDKRRPFVFVRALLVAMPLAILVGSIVSPPDPFIQIILIAGTLIGGFPLAVRMVGTRRYGPKELGVFFGGVLGVTLVGLWVVNAVGTGPVPDVLARFVVVLGALVIADVAVFRI